jgi:hypothetical protein
MDAHLSTGTGTPAGGEDGDQPTAPAAVDAGHRSARHAGNAPQVGSAQLTWSFGVSVTRRPISSSCSAAASAVAPPPKNA